jgi:hypothetical protein
MAGLLGLGIGGAMSQGGRQIIRLVTTGAIISGMGMAGFGYYGSSMDLPPEADAAQAFIVANSKLLIGFGIAAIVLGALVSFWARQRMMKQATAGMPGMGGGGSPDMNAMMAGMGGMQREVVKVRCKSCNSLELEDAAFCSKCGKSMA